MDLAAGTLVTENVRLIEPLGEGGMGSVWVADHLGLRTRVAVKFIAQELLEDDPDMVKRFRREAGAAARIKSPHVVQTLDHGVMDDGTPYIVMELLEGESLAQRLERVGTLPLDHIADILTQVARGLGRAHAAGIVHRDIKPDNVFLLGGEEDELFVKLLDFGVAKHTATPSYSIVTSTGAMIGTPGYMSPEQVLTGKNVDLRSDLWSLAVVTYYSMIGDIPFQGETLGALCVSITRGDHTPPSRLRADVPAAVDAWMTRALSLDPRRRFQSAKELAVTFRAALRGETTWAEPSLLEFSTVKTVVASDDSLPTVQLASPLHPNGASGAYGTVVMDSGAIPVAAPEPMTVVLDDEVETRRRERLVRAARRRWWLASAIAVLGFASGFAIVLVVLPKTDQETTSGPPLPAVTPTSVTSSAPSMEAPSIEAPVVTSAAVTASVVPRALPRRPAPSPVSSQAPPPPVPSTAPRPQEKDRGF